MHGTLAECCISGTVEDVSTRKIVCATSLALGFAFVGVLALGSEVRAGGLLGFDGEDVPLATVTVDTDTLNQAQVFAGEYVFVGGQKERDGIDAAITAAMDAVNPVVRSLGRKRLHETTQVPKRVTIELEGERAQISFDGKGHSVSLDGSAIKAESAEGEKVKVSHRMRGSSLVQLIDGIGGDRQNRFRLSSDGSRLTCDVEISSPQLPVSVEYRLTFKRQ